MKMLIGGLWTTREADGSWVPCRELWLWGEWRTEASWPSDSGQPQLKGTEKVGQAQVRQEASMRLCRLGSRGAQGSRSTYRATEGERTPI